jgi:protein TonB
MNRFLSAVFLLTGLAFAPVIGRAQSATAMVAYTGPRYPGGPDSLRALVARSTRQAAAAPAGRMLVQFELRPDGRPYNFGTVRLPEANKPLAKAATTATQYLAAHMQPWQPASKEEKTPSEPEPKMSLLLDFGTPPTSQPYSYPDQNPVFGTVVQYLRAQYARTTGKPLTEADMQDSFAFGASAKGLAQYIQSQVRYPAQALRNGESGKVYAYFEVAANGTVEQASILGSAGTNLDAEVLRVVKSLPTATTPAVLNGKPARIYYILPVTFKMI